jgi:hypothetical protein
MVPNLNDERPVRSIDAVKCMIIDRVVAPTSRNHAEPFPTQAVVGRLQNPKIDVGRMVVPREEDSTGSR